MEQWDLPGEGLKNMARYIYRKGLLAIIAGWLVAWGLAGTAWAQEQTDQQVLALPDNAVVAASIKKEMSNPAVLRLQKLYAEAGLTTGQMQRLRQMDARAFAMARFATKEDIQEFHRERATVLTDEQLKHISDIATDDFRARLRGRTRVNSGNSITSESLINDTDDMETTETSDETDDGSTMTLEIVPISSPEDEASSAGKAASEDESSTSSANDSEEDADGGTRSAATADDAVASPAQGRKSSDE